MDFLPTHTHIIIITQVRLLAANGARVNVSGQDGWFPLHLAAINGHAGCASALLDHAASVEAPCRDG